MSLNILTAKAKVNEIFNGKNHSHSKKKKRTEDGQNSKVDTSNFLHWAAKQVNFAGKFKEKFYFL